MLNQCNFIGNLAADPEMRKTNNGVGIANFSIGVSEKRKDSEHTEWVRCVAFDKTADIAGRYLTKGKQVHITGRMQTRKWQDKDGNDKYSTEIIVDRLTMLGGPKSSVEAYKNKEPQNYTGPSREQVQDLDNQALDAPDLDDTIPF